MSASNVQPGTFGTSAQIVRHTNVTPVNSASNVQPGTSAQAVYEPIEETEQVEEVSIYVYVILYVNICFLY